MDRPQLSVIVATRDPAPSLTGCLERLRRSCAGLDAELIVVDGSGQLVPELWAEGYRRSRGRIVAFTTAQCLVSETWAPALIEAIESGAAGAGGPFALAGGTGPLDWAVFYLRYSAFTPEALGSGRIAGEIAGDNAAYRRDALDRHAATFERGFWEVDFHGRVRKDGGYLAAVPRAVVGYGGSPPLAALVRHRFAHGRHFGAGRAEKLGKARLVLAAPAVPCVLAARAGRRVVRGHADRWRFLAALPWLLLLASAWAAGEAWGALTGRGVPSPEPSADIRRSVERIRAC
jgi:hypothetical protein